MQAKDKWNVTRIFSPSVFSLLSAFWPHPLLPSLVLPPGKGTQRWNLTSHHWRALEALSLKSLWSSDTRERL